MCDVSSRKSFLSRPHFRTYFSSDEDFLAIAILLEPLADNGFRFPALVARRPRRVDIRRIDEVETGGYEFIKEAKGGLFIHRPAKDVSAKCKRRNFQSRISKFPFGHGQKIRC